MSQAICPSRVLTTSIKLLMALECQTHDAATNEEIDNNIHELQELRARLSRAGATYIKPSGRTNKDLSA